MLLDGGVSLAHMVNRIRSTMMKEKTSFITATKFKVQNPQGSTLLLECTGLIHTVMYTQTDIYTDIQTHTPLHFALTFWNNIYQCLWNKADPACNTITNNKSPKFLKCPSKQPKTKDQKGITVHH